MLLTHNKMADIIRTIFIQMKYRCSRRMQRIRSYNEEIFSAVFFSILSSHVYATINYDLLLKPEKTESFSNQLWWSISGSCSIETTESLITLDIVIQGEGSVNGRKLTSGEHMKINAYNGQLFFRTAISS